MLSRFKWQHVSPASCPHCWSQNRSLLITHARRTSQTSTSDAVHQSAATSNKHSVHATAEQGRASSSNTSSSTPPTSHAPVSAASTIKDQQGQHANKLLLIDGHYIAFRGERLALILCKRMMAAADGETRAACSQQATSKHDGELISQLLYQIDI